jgi:hypothetical protein
MSSNQLGTTPVAPSYGVTWGGARTAAVVPSRTDGADR